MLGGVTILHPELCAHGRRTNDSLSVCTYTDCRTESHWPPAAYHMYTAHRVALAGRTTVGINHHQSRNRLHASASIHASSSVRIRAENNGLLQEIMAITEIVTVDTEINEAKIALLEIGMLGGTSKFIVTMRLTTRQTKICPISSRGSLRVIMLRSPSWSWITEI